MNYLKAVLLVPSFTPSDLQPVCSIGFKGPKQQVITLLGGLLVPKVRGILVIYRKVLLMVMHLLEP